MRRGVRADRDKLRGFSLLEILLALVVFGFGVVVLSAAYINVLEGIERVRTDRAFDQEMKWVREQVQAQTDLKEVEKGGQSSSPDFGKIQWDVVVDPTGIADLFHVSIHVKFEGSGEKKEREATQDFMALRPQWSEPLDRDKLRAESKKRIEDSRREAGVLSQRAK